MKYSKLILAILTMTASFPAIGNDFSNSGTRGGGSVVDANGRPRLRDLVEQTECEWITAADFIRDEVGQLDALLARIEQIDWYVADKLRTEGLSLNICKSDRRLRTVPVEETDGLTIYQPLRNLRQVAIRVNRDVYIDMATFRRLPDSEKASLYLHETLHSFIQTDVPNRNSLLMNAVRYLSQVSPSTSPENFALNLRMNAIDICTDCSSRLATIKETFLNVVNPTLPAEQRQAAAIALIPASHVLSGDEYNFVGLLILQYEAAHGNFRANEMRYHYTERVSMMDGRVYGELSTAFRFDLLLTARFISNRLLAASRREGQSHIYLENTLYRGMIGAVLYGSDDDANAILSNHFIKPFEPRGINASSIFGLSRGTVSEAEWSRRLGGPSASIYRFVQVTRPALLPTLCARPDANFQESPCVR